MESSKTKFWKAWNNIGFDPAQFNGKRVILKPNLLLPSKVERAIITNPEFFRAVVQIVRGKWREAGSG